ncbi:hypothetical protein FOC1_g10012103, partial [Fusarium oxysporum f. sp. cubense race 1]
HDSRAGKLDCCFEPIAWRSRPDRAEHRMLGFMPLSLLMKKLGRSLATAHPPPEPYAKKSRQCKRGRGGAR